VEVTATRIVRNVSCANILVGFKKKLQLLDLDPAKVKMISIKLQLFDIFYLYKCECRQTWNRHHREFFLEREDVENQSFEIEIEI
jgi:hypothetical protein